MGLCLSMRYPKHIYTICVMVGIQGGVVFTDLTVFTTYLLEARWPDSLTLQDCKCLGKDWFPCICRLSAPLPFCYLSKSECFFFFKKKNNVSLFSILIMMHEREFGKIVTITIFTNVIVTSHYTFKVKNTDNKMKQAF